MSDGFGHEKPGEGITNDWITPKWILEALGEFDLDPCASITQPWPTAKRDYRLPEQNGLLLPWEGRIWCNPPYGPHAEKWIERMRHHGKGTLLIFARTDTQAFRKVWDGADGILFMSKRVSFNLPDGSKAKSGTAPSCLVSYGKEDSEILHYAKIKGAYCENWALS